MRWHDKFDSWQSICAPVCSCCVSPDVELTLLAFALARGSVAKVIQALSCISDHLDTKYKASPLIVSMASVRLRLLYRNGNVNVSSSPLLHTRTLKSEKVPFLRSSCISGKLLLLQCSNKVAT